MAGVRPSGHLQVKGEAGKRRYYALWRDADGRHQRLLGPGRIMQRSWTAALAEQFPPTTVRRAVARLR
jgi:hypothetical protein